MPLEEGSCGSGISDGGISLEAFDDREKSGNLDHVYG